VRGFFGAFGSLGFGLKLLRDLGVAAAAAARTSASYLRATSAQCQFYPGCASTRQHFRYNPVKLIHTDTFWHTTCRSGPDGC